MANDLNDKNNNVRFFNNPTIEFIRDLLDTAINKEFDLLSKLKEHIEIISNQVLDVGLKEVKIIKSDMDDNELIKCDENIKPNDVTADELDNISFVGKEFLPPHRYYINEDKFTIEIQICSDINRDTLKINKKWIKDGGEFKFEIFGERLLDEKEDSNIGIEIHELINKRTWKNFKLEFKIRIKDYTIQGLGEYEPEEKIKIKYGILFINYKILK